MKQAVIIGVIIGVIALISAVQAFQLSSLKAKIAEDQPSVDPSGSKTASSSPDRAKKTSALPSNIANLPKMVGGC